jgi:hypothetical protein
MKHTGNADIKVVSISASSKQILDRFALLNVVVGAVLRPDGRYDIELDEDTLEYLMRLDPDIDVAIERLASGVQ